MTEQANESAGQKKNNIDALNTLSFEKRDWPIIREELPDQNVYITCSVKIFIMIPVKEPHQMRARPALLFECEQCELSAGYLLFAETKTTTAKTSYYEPFCGQKPK